MSRTNNINNHITDSASAVKFNPENTAFPSEIVNVQDALNEIGEYALKGKMPIATEEQRGIIQLATIEEARLGIDKEKAITPFTLNDVVTKPYATETTYGTTRYATESESLNITQMDTTITPKRLDYVFNTRNATEGINGTLKISTSAQAISGTDDTTGMTPLKVNQAIQALVPRQATATETIEGTVKLATSAQMISGTLNVGVAVSPKAFATTNATTATNGTVKLATSAQIMSGIDNTTAISPLGLHSSKGSINGFGIVTLTLNPDGGGVNTALAHNAHVVPKARTINGLSLFNNISLNYSHVGAVPTFRAVNGKQLGGDIWIGANDTGAYTYAQSDARYMVKGDYGGIGAMVLGRIGYDVGYGATVWGQDLTQAGIHNDMKSSKTAEILGFGGTMPYGSIWRCLGVCIKGNSPHAVSLFQRVS